MRILFVHQNFPAQFRYLAPALIKRGHDVRVLTSGDNQNKTPLDTARYGWGYEQEPIGPGTYYAEHSERGFRAAQLGEKLLQRGYTPDLIIGHPGWGETLFLKQVWPDAKLLHFAELYYGTRGLDIDFDPEFSSGTLNSRISTICRQAHLAHGLCQADMSLAPTQFQADTFPPMFRDRLRVIHEGVDTVKIAPNPAATLALDGGTVLQAGDEVLTFVNRNLEPYRGFHIFMRALPEVLRARPDAQVVLVGGEHRGYGPLPKKGGSWKDVMLRELNGQLDLSRVHYLGRVDFDRYKALIQITRVHAYLTYPFVLSWSMLEAMAMGAHVIGSDTAPVREIIRDGKNGQLVDFFDVNAWSQALITGLSDPDRFDPLRRAARETIVENYDLHTRCLPKQVALVEGMLNG